jgi:hypothetical protein
MTSVSDYVADFVMSSLKTCNMNCGSCWEGEGRVGSKGWAVDHQPGTSVDGHSHHDHQKEDFQVSEKGGSLYKEGETGTRGSKGEFVNRAIFTKCCTCVYRCHVLSHLMNVVFRL